MVLHGNAALTWNGRRDLVALVLVAAGWPARARRRRAR